MKKVKQIIGRSEMIDLPELKLSRVKAKIDTGAYGNSMHCSEMEEVEIDGKKMLRVVPLQRKKDKHLRESFYFEFVREKSVKSSSGETENRPVIKTRLRIFDREEWVEFSLTDRSNMKFPILLGRTFLKGKYLVDVSKSNLSLKQHKNQIHA